MTAATVGSKLFRERLQPELDAADKDQRSQRAYEYVLEAIQTGNAAKAQKAFDLMVQRWAEREALLSAPAWLWKQRHGQVSAIAEACANDDPLLDAVWWQFYRTGRRADGASEPAAAAYAADRVRNMQALDGRG